MDADHPLQGVNIPRRITIQLIKVAGKQHKIAIVAPMRKLVILANVLLRDGRTWSSEPPAVVA